MASTKHFFILAIVAVLVPSIFPMDFVVGDGNGWNYNVDYQSWARGKEFHVGDTLVFNYRQGDHNVIEVDEAGFQRCKAPAGAKALTSGKDVITLSAPGRYSYICGVDSHCVDGDQKLAITVLPQIVPVSPAASPAASPPPAPPSAARRMVTPVCYGWMTAIFGIPMMIMI